MSEIILHQYPQSPVAEKVRVGFGIKKIPWRAVEIPRLPPKPDLIPLTGGYRRTPVMQIGADIFCDSQCILREIERRHPEPAYFAPDAAGLAWGMSRWLDDRFFANTIKLVLAGAGDALPADFAQDRGRLYFGPEWQQKLKEARSELDQVTAQLRGQFSWFDQHLTRAPFLAGESAGLVDACGYYLVWFVRGRWDKGPEFLSQFEHIAAWEERIQAIGHGTATDLSPADALDIAKNSEIATLEKTDPLDAQGLVPGMTVYIQPDLDGGEVSVTGQVHVVSSDTIAVLRDSDQTGQVCVHFPRVGYRVTIV